MKVRVLKPVIVEGTQRATRGNIIEVSDMRANQLIRKGIAIPASDPKKIDRSKKAGPIPPTLQPQTGIPTGEEQPSSVLPQDQVQEEVLKTSKRSSRRKGSRAKKSKS
jgi:hypothetical protein